MVSKNLIKYVKSLELKKNRRHEGLFVAEGPKVVADLMKRATPHTVIAVRGWIDAHAAATPPYTLVEATDDELRKVSFLQHPQQVVALFGLPDGSGAASPEGRLTLALDGVQDPGNLGTIIRIADWFGIDTIYCSPDTADAYNPKVVQATMGSIARVSVVYTDLADLIDRHAGKLPVYGTLLDGQDIYSRPLSAEGMIVMGNEGNGISPAIRERISRKLLIPNFRPGDSAESLNVAIATAITCSEFRRRGHGPQP